MTITTSGLGSGLDYATWIEQLVGVKQEKIDKVTAQVTQTQNKTSALNTLETEYKALQSKIQSFTDILSTDDPFKQKAATSSSDAISAEVTTSAIAQNLSISVSQLATSTTAKSSYTVGSYVTGDTKINKVAEGTIKEGSFSIYVNGEKNSIDIKSDDTIQSVLDELNGITGVSATLSEDGKLSISSNNGSSVVVGSSSDTSNFSNVMSLVRNTETGEYTSSKSVFDTDTSAKFADTTFRGSDGSDVTVTAGTFTIGDTEFTINENTTLDSLITVINKSKAGVSAYWDANSGKLSLTSLQEGATNINIEAGTSNFTDVMGLTTTVDGVSSINNGSQELGTNAILTINGTTITSSTNKVTSDITGITGLTLNLNKETTSTNVNITQDSTALIDKIKDLVDSFNKIVTDTNTATSSDGTLKGESLLVSIKNSIRRSATAAIDTDGLYKTLASIGITSGAVSTDVSADTSKLVIDEKKLQEAINNDVDAVKNLLVGSYSQPGVLKKMQTPLDNALTVSSGYFDSREASFDKQVTNLNKKITKMNSDLESYRARLETKFQAMDELISKLNDQASIFDSYFNKNDDDDK